MASTVQNCSVVVQCVIVAASPFPQCTDEAIFPYKASVIFVQNVNFEGIILTICSYEFVNCLGYEKCYKR